MTQPRTLLSIQYLRGLAAVAVVAYHTHWTHSDLGSAGVDVFFVISGFIMANVSRRETTPTVFLRARALRVVPLYWMVTLLTAAVTTRPLSAGHLLQSLAFWPHPGPEGFGWPVIIQGWTLCFEAIFYAVFAAALLVPRHVLPMLTVFLLTLMAVITLQPDLRLAFGAYNPLLMLEFLSGVWLCQAWHRGWLRLTWPALPIGILAFAAQAALPTPDGWRWLVWGTPATLAVAGALSIEAKGALPSVPALHRLGDASYALYLTQSLVLDGLTPILHPLPAVLAVPTAVLACVAVGWTTHRYFERPVTGWLNESLASRQVATQSGAV